jgi:hypothetical protein
MEVKMKKLFLSFFALTAVSLLSVTAMAQVKTHSVWTNNNGLAIRDAQTACTYTSLTGGFSGFNMATSWTEPTPGDPAEAHFRGVAKAVGFSLTCLTRSYDFRLVASTVTGNDNIDGTWNIFRNGVLVCSACNGTAYGLSQAAGLGNYYKVYVDDPIAGPQTWLYSGYLDVRKDF